MNTVLVVAIAVAVVGLAVFLWSRFATPKTTAAVAPSPVIAADFAAKEKVEAARIDGESNADLLRDLNRRD